ncbi:MAG: hypothetical protein JSV76_01745, partial [Candidatus Bathyarchaeota archaeon]
MYDQDSTTRQVRTYFYIVIRQKWKILSLFLATILTVALGSLMTTPMYQASAKLLVKPGREDIYVSPTGGSPSVVDHAIRKGQKVNAEIAILSSLELVTKLVQEFGVDRLYDYPDQTLKGRIFKNKIEREIPSFRKVRGIVYERLEVSALPNSNVMQIRFKWPDPAIAAKVVNKLLKIYFVQHVKVHVNPKTYNLLKEETDKWKMRLLETEEALEAYRNSHAITSISEQRTILLGKLSESESEMIKTQGEIQETIQMIRATESQLSKLKNDIQLQERLNESSPTLIDLKKKLVELKLQGLREEINHV